MKQEDVIENKESNDLGPSASCVTLGMSCDGSGPGGGWEWGLTCRTKLLDQVSDLYCAPKSPGEF